MKIVGITIGPIGETLSLAQKPAMLWYASSVFSNLSFILCKNIKNKIEKAEILAPFVNDYSSFASDGIGKYHDRVIFKTENIDKLDEVISASKLELSEMISMDINKEIREDDIKFLENYIQIKYCVVDEASIDGNIILGISESLDALEQMRTFNPDNTNNTFARFFGSDKCNSSIAQCKMLDDVENSQLKKDKTHFRSIEDICNPSKSPAKENDETQNKPHNYYAVIQADGDKIGAYLSSLKNENINVFSKQCIDYATSVAETISKYGGMTIYAGGDDLLAIAPVLGKENKNIFDLCIEIGNCFDEIVKQKKDYPTVSIGVAIRYNKFPLYEALASAGEVLFGYAKTGEKNNTCIDFQKHSGQSVKLLIPSEKLGFVSKLMKSGDSETVNSIIYILDEFKELIDAGKDSEETIKNIFENLYDNASQQKYSNYIKELANSFIKIASADPDRKITVCDCDNISDAKTFEGVLRLKKFLNQEVTKHD